MIDHHDLYSEGSEPGLASEEAYSVGDALQQALKHAADDLVARHRFETRHAEELLIVQWRFRPRGDQRTTL